MLGYMTASQAKAAGFTHHGKYYFLPIWMTDDDCPMVATKWAPFEYVMSFMLECEIASFRLKFPDEEPCFQFLMGEPIQ